MPVNTFECGEILSGKWELVRKISQGSFGELFVARDITSGTVYAIKIQSSETDARLKWESEVLTAMNDSDLTPQIVLLDQYAPEHDFIVMQLLGEDMSALRRRARQNTFKGVPLPVVAYLSLQMLKCIEALHLKGFVHRDVKPANFVRKSHTSTEFCIIDFGIAKQHVSTSSGKIRCARESAEFRGTTMYASLHSHDLQDLSFRDDLWSFLFVFIDLFVGKLPWTEEARRKEKSSVADIKRKYVGDPTQLTKWIFSQIHQQHRSQVEMLDVLSERITDVVEYIGGLGYKNMPNYNKLRTYLNELLSSQSVSQEALDVPNKLSELPTSLVDVSCIDYVNGSFNWKCESLYPGEFRGDVPDVAYEMDIRQYENVSQFQSVITARAWYGVNVCKKASPTSATHISGNGSENLCNGAVFDVEESKSDYITPLHQLSRLWKSLYMALLSVPKEYLQWSTVSSLKHLLDNCRWFYAIGQYTFSNPENTIVSSSDFFLLQKDIYDFMEIYRQQLQVLPEIVSFSKQKDV